jgi:demethylmenaquinone methyltransferase/2-methoxy-6-polyprenyl-1,4-benzoquinol methylase
VAKGINDLTTGIVVADLSMGMLRQVCLAQFLDCNRMSPINCPSERLPFSDETFERILMIDALHHVNNQAETIAELWRVLKKGGRIIIEEPDVRKISVKFVALGEKLALMRSHFLSPPRIAALFVDPSAKKRIVLDGFNAWIVVEKFSR